MEEPLFGSDEHDPKNFGYHELRNGAMYTFDQNLASGSGGVYKKRSEDSEILAPETEFEEINDKETKRDDGDTEFGPEEIYY